MDSSNQVVVVAGGSGSRMGASQPKQFLPIAGRPILMHTLDRLLEFDPNLRIVLVLPAEHHLTWKELCLKHHYQSRAILVEGGETRYHSVQAGMKQVKPEGVVGVHDGVRPLVSIETLKRCFETAAEKGNAVPAIPVVETLRQVGSEGKSVWVDRQHYQSVQTPQCFKAEWIQRAYQQDYHPEFTDDASVMEHAGLDIQLVEGNRENLKITTPEDIQLAEAWLQIQHHGNPD